MKTPLPSPRLRGMTLVELLVVLAIIVVLASVLFPSLNKMKEITEAMKSSSNLQQIAVATLNWSTDHRNKLPSPQYPGGMEPPPGTSDEDFFPEHWDLADSGLWLDGVIFAELYLKEENLERAGDEGEDDGKTAGYSINEEGDHLKGTFFESLRSVKKNPLEKNWHKHSYAMNANLQYDRIYKQVDSPDPYLTEKTLANLVFSPQAMLYIDCIETNVVMFEDRQEIVDTIEKRWDGGKAIAVFLDGHAERLRAKDIPEESPETDRQSSRFWRGIDLR